MSNYFKGMNENEALARCRTMWKRVERILKTGAYKGDSLMFLKAKIQAIQELYPFVTPGELDIAGFHHGTVNADCFCCEYDIQQSEEHDLCGSDCIVNWTGKYGCTDKDSPYQCYDIDGVLACIDASIAEYDKRVA